MSGVSFEPWRLERLPRLNEVVRASEAEIARLELIATVRQAYPPVQEMPS
jgi:hypothetical protein